jgi:hypothetical protein
MVDDTFITVKEIGDATEQVFGKLAWMESKAFGRVMKMLESANTLICSGHILQRQDGGYNVESETDYGTTYHVTHTTCDCGHFAHGGMTLSRRKWCKHLAAVRIYENILVSRELAKEETDPMNTYQPRSAVYQTAPPPMHSTLNGAVSTSAATLATLPAPVFAPVAGISNEQLFTEQRRTNELLMKLIDLMATKQAPSEIAAQAQEQVYAPQPTVVMASAPVDGDCIVLRSTAIVKGVDERTGRTVVKVLAGNLQNWGVAVYPEYFNKIGITLEALPFGPTPWEYDVVIQMKNGKPYRVVGLAPEAVAA